MRKNVLQINIAYLQLVAHVFVCVLGKMCVYMFTNERGTGNEKNKQKLLKSSQANLCLFE